jgi:hypothetical protein
VLLVVDERQHYPLAVAKYGVPPHTNITHNQQVAVAFRPTALRTHREKNMSDESPLLKRW